MMSLGSTRSSFSAVSASLTGPPLYQLKGALLRHR